MTERNDELTILARSCSIFAFLSSRLGLLSLSSSTSSPFILSTSSPDGSGIFLIVWLAASATVSGSGPVGSAMGGRVQVVARFGYGVGIPSSALPTQSTSLHTHGSVSSGFRAAILL